MSDEINEKASALGRILAMFQMSANQGQPPVILEAHLRRVHRLSGELADLLTTCDPSTVVEMDPMLGDATSDLLADYFLGYTKSVPDSLEGEDWT